MKRFIVAYASHEGQTQKVAHHVAMHLERLGHTARLLNVGDDQPDALLGEFDAAFLAGDLDSSARAAALAAFVAAHKDELKAVPIALLSITLDAAAAGAQSKAAMKEQVDAFKDKVGLKPKATLVVGGAFHDRSHNFLTRAALHVWMQLKGITPDPSGHTELTDWTKVDAFVGEFALEVGASAEENAPAVSARAAAQKQARKTS